MPFDESDSVLNADRLDAALAAMWRGDSSALNRLIETAVDSPGAGVVYRGLVDLQANLPRAPLMEGARIGNYEIIREIGRGGMGVVYAARQRHPQRDVAVKLLRWEFGGADALRRFDREARLLGRMQHAGIATVFEGGTFEAATGPQPYYVMELVEGERITDYAAQRGLSIEQRLGLMALVCETVQYAHQRGVIHRDLKPANILITRDGQPKVLDFGVARLLGDEQAETLQTQAGELVGTLPYMSPEQVVDGAHAADVRSDVYSLGVMLFELCAGRLPHDLANSSPAEAARRIGNDPPARLGELDRAWRGDLDTIAARALDRDPNRRFQSALALGEDIRRHLRGEPIESRRDNAWYVLRKTLGRHRIAAATSAAFLLLLTAGLVTTFSLWRQATEQRTIAQNAQRAEAAQLKKLETKVRELQAVNRFVRGMLASPKVSLAGHDVTVRQVLDDAAGEVAQGVFKDQPETECTVRTTLGDSYLALGLYSQALEQLREAVRIARDIYTPPDAALLLSIDRLATVLARTQEYGESERLFREALEMRRQLSSADDSPLAESLNNLANMLRQKGKLDEAEKLFRESLAIARATEGDMSDGVASVLSNLGLILCDRKQWAAAQPLFEESLSIHRNAVPGGLGVAVVANNLARAYRYQGDTERAIPLFQESLEIRRKLQGPRHPDVAMVAHNAGTMYTAAGDFAAAEPMYREAFEIRSGTLPLGHPDIATSQFGLCEAVLRQGRYPEAEALLRECEAMMQQHMPGHWAHLAVRSMWGDALAGLGRFEEAEPLVLDAQTAIEKLASAPPSPRQQALKRVVKLYTAWGKSEQAAEWQKRLDDSESAAAAP